MSRARRLTAACLSATLALSPIAASAAPQATPAQTTAAPKPPPSTLGYQPQGKLEKGLWFEMDEQERLLKQSKFLVTDPALNGYVRSVLCRTVGADADLRARIVNATDVVCCENRSGGGCGNIIHGRQCPFLLVSAYAKTD